MSRFIRSTRRVYGNFDAQCSKLTEPALESVGNVPVKILLMFVATCLAIAGWVPDTVAPNAFTAACYMLVVPIVVAALVVLRVEKTLYQD